MPHFLKRVAKVVKLGVIAGIAVGIVRTVRGSNPPEVTGQASWQPLTDSPTAEKRTGPVQFTSPPADEAAEPEQADAPPTSWVEPVDGVCPLTHPVKGNADSGIFHVPGGTSYERTVPERCYASEADAEADGFRKAKR